LGISAPSADALRIEHICLIIESVKGSEFLRRLKSLPRRERLAYRWRSERGVGSHGTVYLGNRFTVLKDLKKELGPGLLSAMYKQLGISEGGPLMFTASYPASFLPEEAGRGFHVRFPDLPEALTGGSNRE
jgi:hypothetical protein